MPLQLTHLAKLDVIQKIAARIILGAPSQAHSAPLLNQLKLEPLLVRRADHYATIVDNIFNGVSHPYFKDFFSKENSNPRLSIANPKLNAKRLSRFGPLLRVNINSVEVFTHPLDRSLLGHPITYISSNKCTTATSINAILYRLPSSRRPSPDR